MSRTHEPKRATNKRIEKPKHFPISRYQVEALIAGYPEHRDELELAMHCTRLAWEECQMEDRTELFVSEEGIVPTGINEWLCDLAGVLPRPVWGKVKDVLLLMYKLLLRENPEALDLVLAIVVLKNPDLYEMQLRLQQEETIIECLELEDKPELIKRLGLAQDDAEPAVDAQELH